jgi:hypothetical protein
MRVLESALAPHLKFTAAALALFARDDGTEIFPSVGRVAFLIGKTERAVRGDLAALCEAGVLVPETPRTGGRSRMTRYRLAESALPQRDAWSHKRGSGLPGLEDKPGSEQPETRKWAAKNPEVDFPRSVSSDLLGEENNRAHAREPSDVNVPVPSWVCPHEQAGKERCGTEAKCKLWQQLPSTRVPAVAS